MFLPQIKNPLVIFLDDLQWADIASLNLLKLLTTDSGSKYQLIIGAYRDNEVSATHPLMLTLDEICQSHQRIHTITLRPLDIDNINQLVADTLRDSSENVKPLAELLQAKTDGNPFFLNQLFKSLYQENLLSYNFASHSDSNKTEARGVWQWDIKQIEEMRITDNVVELMVSKIQKLDKNTQNILTLAACIGNRFDLNTLAFVCEKSPKETATYLWSALQLGLILPLGDTYKIPRFLEQFDNLVIPYKFLHDRVQQGAYALIPDNNKKEVHLKVGRLLLKNTKVNEIEENIFEIVNQLNAATELITSQSENMN
ncbi:MAG: hypothetical protein HC908_13310 [Calothrix sp. SM1_7_51]|nr:hypothetical protein [Calothrix sp. SM1_7_51]